MAIVRLKLSTDARRVARRLRALADGFDGPIHDTLEAHARTVTGLAMEFMRHGQPSWRTSSAAKLYGSYTGAIAAHYRWHVDETNAQIYSEHPAAPVWEWGGQIHPAAGSDFHKLIISHPPGSPMRLALQRGQSGLVFQHASGQFAKAPIPGLPYRDARGRFHRRPRAITTHGVQVIDIPRTLPVSRASKLDKPIFERDLSFSLDRLIHEHGF